MLVTEKFKKIYLSAKISKKITLIYSIFFMILIFLMNIVLWFGVSYALYHPAESTIEYSMKNVEELLLNLEKDPAAFNPNSIREPLVPGVVLRVVDSEGNIFIDTDPKYLSDSRFEENILKNPPYLANNDFEIAKIRNALVYRARMDYVQNGEHVILYFYRTITSMSHIFDQLTMFLIFMDIFGSKVF